MYFLFSGEGATDFGTPTFADTLCEGDNYDRGPMAFVVDRIVHHRHSYSIIEAGNCGFLSKQALAARAKLLKHPKMSMPRKDKEKETAYFFRNARALASYAKDKEKNGDEVVAILFRDSDGNASSGRGEWDAKWNSMIDGFQAEGFSNGVPMLPKPTSEAWFLCALKNDPYQRCDSLEQRSPSPKAKVVLKKELDEILKHTSSHTDLCNHVKDGRIDALLINMPSFNKFRERLLEVI